MIAEQAHLQNYITCCAIQKNDMWLMASMHVQKQNVDQGALQHCALLQLGGAQGGHCWVGSHSARQLRKCETVQVAVCAYGAHACRHLLL